MPAKGTRAKKVIMREEVNRLVTAQMVAAIAQQKAEAKIRPTFMQQLEDHMWSFVDRIEPLDVAAVAALTIILKPIVQKIPDIASAMASNLPFGLDLAIEAVQKGKLVILSIKNPLTGKVIWEWSYENENVSPIDTSNIVPPIPDLNAWLFSFALAVIIIRFGPAVVQAAGGLQGMAKMLVGVV